MHIVFLSYTFWPPSFGGELLTAEERLKALANRGHQVTVLTAGVEGFLPKDNAGEIQIYRSPFIGKNKLARILGRIIFWFWSLGKLLSTPKVDIVHFGSLPGFDEITTNLYGGLVAWISHCKLAKTVYVHSLASEEGNYFTLNVWQRIFFHFIDYLVCVSGGLYEAVRQIYPYKAKKILYGVQDTLFVPLTAAEKDQFRQVNGVNGSDVVFTFLGSIGKRKGFDLVAEASSEAFPKHNNWRLWVVGPRNRVENQNVNEQEVSQ